MVSSTSSRTGGPKRRLQQLPLQRLHEVLGDVLVHVEVLVAGHPEDVVLDDLHALEELAQMGRDDVLQRDEPVLGGRHEPGQLRWHLDPGEHGVIVRRVPHQ